MSPSPSYVVFLAFVVLAACGVVYCLYTGFNPFQPRRWYDRAGRVIVAVVAFCLLFLLLFGDS